ncbi:MAG: type II secretion system protein [Opitutaceae bacterium]|jgi:uncharacterized protein (TIGR02598 family)
MKTDSRISCGVSKAGFSLVEVVVAIGIFALAIVGVIGLLSPTTKNVADVADSDSATRAISAIQAALQESVSSSSTGFTDLAGVLQTPSSGALPTYNFYSARDGHLVGKAGDFTSDADKFFEFALLRNTTLSNSGNDGTAGYLAFTISLRWPAYLANGTQVTDVSQKSTMIVSAAVTR